MKFIKLLSPKDEADRASNRSGARPLTTEDLHKSELRIEVMIIGLARCLLQSTRNIMSAISDFAEKQNAFNDRQDAAIADLQDDVANLNEQIAAFQNSSGTITPEDQALLDGLQARAQTITDKLEALDALTPPKPPTA